MDVGMLAKRVIPCLDVTDGRVVKGTKFLNLRDAGDPVECAKMYDAQGADEFLRLAAAYGVAGIIIPDLPVDEAAEVRAAAREAGVALVALAAPTTDDERMAEIGGNAEGFVYLVAVTGVTGGDMSIDDRLRALVDRARRHISVPVVVGFGVRTPEQAGELGGLADGVVIASEIIRRIGDAPDAQAADAEVDRFGAGIADALRG